MSYTILPKTSGGLTGTLTLKAYAYGAQEDTNTLEAGKPYKLVADYVGTEDVYYMFTVYNTNEKTKYMNHYTTSGEIMFVPGKYDTYTITVRVINANSFGYMDISQRINLVSLEG